MGLFSDKCTQCQASVKKSAKFCSKCGAAPPGGWVRCHGCNKWAGNDSEFCHSCNVPLRPKERNAIAGDRLQRTGDFLLQRLDFNDIKKNFKTNFTIEIGTLAVLIKNQKCVDILTPGEVNIDSFWKKLLSFGKEDDLDIIVIDSGEVAFSVNIANLRTIDGLSFEAYTEVAIKIDADEVEQLIVNLLKEKRSISTLELSQAIHTQIRSVADQLTRELKSTDLLFDPQARLVYENSLSNAIFDCADNYGVTILRVCNLQLRGPEIRQLINTHKAEHEEARRIEYDMRMRDLMKSDQLSKLKTDAEVKEYADQLAYEYDIKSEDQTFQLNLLQQVHRHELEGKEAVFQMDQRLKEHEHNLAIKRQSMHFDVEESREWLKVKSEKQKMTRDDELERMKAYKNFDIQTLIATLPPEKAASLLQLHKQMQNNNIPDTLILNQLNPNNNPQLQQAINSQSPVSNQLADSIIQLVQSQIEKPSWSIT